MLVARVRKILGVAGFGDPSFMISCWGQSRDASLAGLQFWNPCLEEHCPVHCNGFRAAGICQVKTGARQ